MGTIFRQNYQDESSWGFKHPTNRYEKININGQLVQTLTTIPMDASSKVGYLLDTKINHVSYFLTFCEKISNFYSRIIELLYTMCHLLQYG